MLTQLPFTLVNDFNLSRFKGAAFPYYTMKIMNCSKTLTHVIQLYAIRIRYNIIEVKYWIMGVGN